jgi:hypothetical protein
MLFGKIGALQTPHRPGQRGSAIVAAEVLVSDWRITGNAVPNPCLSSESLREQRKMIACVQVKFRDRRLLQGVGPFSTLHFAASFF